MGKLTEVLDKIRSYWGGILDLGAVTFWEEYDPSVPKEEQYDIFRGEGAHLGSVRRSKMKTAMMIANIDRAMEELRAEYETKEMTYKYDAFKMHYIDGASYEEIADIQNCGKNTPSRWSKELIRKMSVKLFGIDGVEKY